MDSVYTSTLLDNQIFSAATYPTKPPRYQTSVTIFTTIPLEEILCPQNIPRCHDQDTLDWIQEIAPRRDPRLYILKVGQDVLKFLPFLHFIHIQRLSDTGHASWSYLMRGRTPMPYAIMARGSPWVTTSFPLKKWPDPSYVSRTTRLAQWWQQLKVNCAPLGHSCQTAEGIAVRFSSLNALRASMSRNPQSSSCEC